MRILSKLVEHSERRYEYSVARITVVLHVLHVLRVEAGRIIHVHTKSSGVLVGVHIYAKNS
jgi:hypothetical protein